MRCWAENLNEISKRDHFGCGSKFNRPALGVVRSVEIEPRSQGLSPGTKLAEIELKTEIRVFASFPRMHSKICFRGLEPQIYTPKQNDVHSLPFQMGVSPPAH